MNIQPEGVPQMTKLGLKGGTYLLTLIEGVTVTLTSMDLAKETARPDENFLGFWIWCGLY